MDTIPGPKIEICVNGPHSGPKISNMCKWTPSRHPLGFPNPKCLESRPSCFLITNGKPSKPCDLPILWGLCGTERCECKDQCKKCSRHEKNKSISDRRSISVRPHSCPLSAGLQSLVQSWVQKLDPKFGPKKGSEFGPRAQNRAPDPNLGSVWGQNHII